MGRPRKNQSQKQAAKKANAENMMNLGKMAQKILSKTDGEPEKKPVGNSRHRYDVLVETNNADSFGSSSKKRIDGKTAPEVLPNENGEPQTKRVCSPRDAPAKNNNAVPFASSKQRFDNVDHGAVGDPSNDPDVPDGYNADLGAVGSSSKRDCVRQNVVSLASCSKKCGRVAVPSKSADSSNHPDVPIPKSATEHLAIPSTSRTPITPKPTGTSAAAISTSLESLFAGFRETSANNNSDQVIMELWRRIDEQDAEIKQLKADKERLLEMNMHIQETLVMNKDDRSFKALAGYPDTEWLLSVSQNSGDSDYLFVKELLYRLFPTGVGKATTTGRPSNNPKGRNKDADDGEQPVQETQQLDPVKVAYIKDRLYERRRILLDPAGVAVAKSKMVNKHIANVIANNPVMRGAKPKKQ